MTDDIPAVNPSNWKTKTYLVGGIAGLALGMMAAYFFARVSEENGTDGASRISAIDTLKLAVALLGIIRQITDLGAGSSKK